MACVKKRRGKWVVDWRDAQGRRHWETKPDKKSANDRLSEVLKNQGVTLTADDRTVKEYGEWLVRQDCQANDQRLHLPRVRNRVKNTSTRLSAIASSAKSPIP